MQLQQGKQTAKLNLLRKRGLLAHTSAAFLKNCCTEKLFSCLRLAPSNYTAYATSNETKNRPSRNGFSHAVGSSSADSIGFGGSVFRR